MPEEKVTNKKKRGRPKIELKNMPDKQRLIMQLAAVMCTDDEIAEIVEINEDTLKAKHNNDIFSECKKKGQAQGKGSLRRLQYKLAESGNATMQIWLGKQFLGQSDKQEITVDTAKSAWFKSDDDE